MLIPACSTVIKTPAEWAALQPPKRITARTLLSKDDVVFEWDPKEYKTAGNPGVGAAMGCIVDPAAGKGQITVRWADNRQEEVMKFKDVRRAGVNLGDDFRQGDKQFTLLKLAKKGV